MKKKMILLMALLASMMNMQAENSVSVSAVTIPQGGTGSFDIVLNNSEELTGYQMTLTLPEGINFVKHVKSARFVEDDHTVSSNANGNVVMLTCLSGGSTALIGNSGTLLTINVSASANLAVDANLTATLTGVTFVTTPEGEQRNLNDVNISITIGNPVDSRTLLDENATTAPASATGVDVRVRRTIVTGVWNTICLPFAMDATQVKAAFGNNVKLGDFAGCVTETDANENVTGITVNFDEATAIAANHPYIIKVDTENDIEEFTVDGVDIAAGEAQVNKDGRKVKIGSTNYWFYNSFIGTYVAGTVVPDNNLFLNSNKFWYSKELTKIKAFRGYFAFLDVLSSVDNGGSARMRIAFNEEVTEVKDVKQVGAKDGRIYNMQGQQLEQPGKGLYIKDGKVFMNK